MAVCLVTGGAGFIGSHLVEALTARGDKVRVLDNFSTGNLHNLDAVRCDAELILGELGNEELLERAASGVEVLFHFATPPWSSFDPETIDAKWARGADTLQVLLAAIKARVKRVVYASSCRIYGHSETARVAEDDWVLPDSPYGFAKLTGEMQCMGFTSLYGLETVRLRYSEVFGPRQCPTSPYAASIPVIVKAMLAGEAPVLDTSPVEYHDFAYVDDAVHAAVLAAQAPRVAGEVFNVGRGRSVSLFEVVDMVNDLLGTRIQPICKQPGVYDAAPRVVDVSRAERDLGFCPSIDLRQGLQRLIDHYAELSGFSLAGRNGAAERGPHFSRLPGATAAKPAEE
jgi:UDP-glucose 4-epimerase